MERRFPVAMLILALLTPACATGSSGDAAGGVVATVERTQSDSDASAGAAAGASPSAVVSSGGDDRATQAETTDEPSEGTPMAASSPLGAFFADDGGFEAALDEYRVRVEEVIVVCMAAQGFEFARSENAFGDNPVQDRQNELTARQWTSEYGFGISTSFDSIAQNQASNPNAAIFLGMSESEREIWSETLTGGTIDDVGGGFGGRPLEEQGCIGQALIETGGQEAIEGLDGFGDVYQEGLDALFDRREMIEVVDAWARCMSENGWPGYAELEDPEDAIGQEFAAITAPLDAALEELTPEEGQALISGDTSDIERLPGLDVDALRALQAKEIELALADLDCYEAEVQAVYEPLRDEFETGLLTEYAAEFEALRTIGD